MMRGLLTGSLLLTRAHLRAGWRGLTAWTGLMSALVVSVAWSIDALYPTLADRVAYARSAGASPAMAAFNGRPSDLTELGGIVSNEVGFIGLIAFPIIAVHLAIRFSRHEEDAGRTELLTAGRLGRLAPLAAAALTVAGCMAVFVVLSAIGLQAAGLPAGGSWLYVATLGLFAASFAAVGLLAAEVSREARPAYTLGMAVVVATFLLRAVIDGQSWKATWASPSGWLAEVHPWGEWNLWPLAAYGALILLCLLLAGVMAERRDLYGGLLAARSGPAYGAPSLGTPVGLAWRFTRVPLLGWLLGTVVWNAAFGGMAGEMTELVASNPSLLEALGVEKPEHMVTSLALLLCGVGASAFGVQAVGRLSHEESHGRLGLVLSTRAARWQLWLAWLSVAMVGAITVLVASGLALGLFTAWSTGDGSNIGSSTGAAVALVIPVAAVVSVAAALHAFVPRFTGLAWVVVGWSTVVGLLAETLRLPDWARELSPLHAVGRVPIEDADGVALVVIAVVGVLLVAGGLVRFGRRDLVTG